MPGALWRLDVCWFGPVDLVLLEQKHETSAGVFWNLTLTRLARLLEQGKHKIYALVRGGCFGIALSSGWPSGFRLLEHEAYGLMPGSLWKFLC